MLTQNVNFLFNKDFRLEIQRLPNTMYFLAEAELPGISASAVPHANPFTVHQVHGDQLVFDSLNVTFRLDEDMKNYEEIVDWMFSYGTPQSFVDYKDDDVTNSNLHRSKYSDATLLTSTNKYNPNIKFNFEGIFPIAVGPILFVNNPTDAEVLLCTVTFAYTKFTMQR